LDVSGPDVVHRPVSALIHDLEGELLANVYRWTGHFPERTRPLLRYLARRADQLGQVYPAARGKEATVALTTVVTALAMNYVHHGSYSPCPEAGRHVSARALIWARGPFPPAGRAVPAKATAAPERRRRRAARAPPTRQPGPATGPRNTDRPAT